MSYSTEIGSFYAESTKLENGADRYRPPIVGIPSGEGKVELRAFFGGIDWDGTRNREKRSSKGVGLQIMDVISQEKWGFPATFGVFVNGNNDRPLINKATDMGGFAVVVPDEDGSYLISRNEVPSTTIFATAPNIYGVAQHIPTVKRWLSEHIW